MKLIVVAGMQSLPLSVIPGFLAVSYASNTGIAFGALQGNNAALIVVSVAIAALIMRYRNKLETGLEAAAGALVLGGTLGNLADRVFRGAVVDYVTVKGLPTFNIADASLTLGAALIITAYLGSKLRK